MTYKDKYHIVFQKQTITGSQYNFAISSITSSKYVADHLTSSNLIATNSQIAALNDALAGEQIEEFWGEVMGSTLDIYALSKTVEIGDRGTVLPLEDFKGLLEEWLAFIS